MDNATTKDLVPHNLEKRGQNADQTGEAFWSNVSQQIGPPGSKTDAQLLTTIKDKDAGPNGFLTSLEITGIQADKGVTAKGTNQDFNARYAADTHQLTYQRAFEKGTDFVTVDMLSGKETTVIASKQKSGANGGSAGDTTVVRNHTGGDVIKFTQNVNGKEVSLLGSDGKPLPGLSTDSSDLHNHPPNLTLNPVTGKIERYDTAAGVTVILDNDGKPRSYTSSGSIFVHSGGEWYSRQKSNGEWTKVNEPKISADGTVHTHERGYLYDGKEHTLTGDGRKAGYAAADHSTDPTKIIRNDHPKTLDEVLQTLDKLEKVLPNNDGLKWFNSLYKQVTQAVKDGIAQGKFQDPKYIEQLDVNFANMYLDAIKNHLQGNPVPGAWQKLFDQRDNPRISPIQFAGAGMMAHILHDLPFTLDKTNNDLGVAPTMNSIQRADFEDFNQVLRDTMPQAMSLLNRGALGLAANVTGETGQEIALGFIGMMRDNAWTAAEALHAGGPKAAETAADLENTSHDAALQVLHPGRFQVPIVGEVPNPSTELPIVILNAF